MNQDILLYTLPQWFVFAAVISSVYGWVEHKKVFSMLGPVIFLLLGLFAALVLWSDLFLSYEFLSPEEIMSEEADGEITADVPFQALLFPAYLIFVLSGLLAVPAFILQWKDLKYKNLLIVITTLTSLFGFFIVVGAVRSI